MTFNNTSANKLEALAMADGKPWAMALTAKYAWVVCDVSRTAARGDGLMAMAYASGGDIGEVALARGASMDSLESVKSEMYTVPVSHLR